MSGALQVCVSCMYACMYEARSLGETLQQHDTDTRQVYWRYVEHQETSAVRLGDWVVPVDNRDSPAARHRRRCSPTSAPYWQVSSETPARSISHRILRIWLYTHDLQMHCGLHLSVQEYKGITSEMSENTRRCIYRWVYTGRQYSAVQKFTTGSDLKTAWW